MRTSPIAERIAAIDDFVAAGYEVHVNFSPVILYEGWEADWRKLFAGARRFDLERRQGATQVRDHPAHAQCSVCTRSISAGTRRPKRCSGGPDIQEAKRSEGGGDNLRYRSGWKGRWLARFQALLAERMPYCTVRYAF